MKSRFEKRLKGSEVEKLKSLLFTLSTFQLFTLSTALGAFEGREITRAPDMCNTEIVDTVSWYAEESVRLSVEPWRCGKRVEIPQGATAAWVVADEGGTNWIVRYDFAPGTNGCAFFLGAGEGNLPEGHEYMGFVSLLNGTNVLGVVDRFEVRVLGMAEDGGAEAVMPPDEYPAIVYAVWEFLSESAGQVASNAAAVAELRVATNDLWAAVEAGGGGSGATVQTNAIVELAVAAALAAAGTNDWPSWTIDGVTRTAWAGGGLSGSRVITTNSYVSADDYLVWLDTRAFSSSDSVTLTLPDMDGDSQTIVVRRLGNTGTATIVRGTNTWTLGYDGDGVTVDWLGAATSWFWRAF